MVPRNNLVQLTLKYTYFRRIIQVNRRFWPLQMVIIHAAPELGEFLQNLRLGGRRIGFVPTMGALHDGHASLIRCAKRETDVVVLSIFVNPTQFNETADFTNYPKTTDADLNLARSEKVDVVFTICNARKNPYFNLVEHEEGFLKISKKLKTPIIRRQDAPKVYEHVASIYVLSPEFIRNGNGLLSGKALGYDIGEFKSLDADSELDFELIEFLMKKKLGSV